MDSRYILKSCKKRQLGNKLPFDFMCIRKNKSLWEYGNNTPVALQNRNKNDRGVKTVLVMLRVSVRVHYIVPINCKNISQDFMSNQSTFFIKIKKEVPKWNFFLAEREGFEPSVPL